VELERVEIRSSRGKFIYAKEELISGVDGSLG